MFIDFRQRGGKEPVVEALNVTENGTYTPKEGIDGFSPVDVMVAGGGIPDAPADGKQYARQNSTWTEVKTGSGEQDSYVLYVPSFDYVTGEIGSPLIQKFIDLNIAEIAKIDAANQANKPINITYRLGHKDFSTDNQLQTLRGNATLLLIDSNRIDTSFSSYSGSTIMISFNKKTGNILGTIKAETSLPDAPADTKTYGRKDNTWVEIPTTGGGGGGGEVQEKNSFIVYFPNANPYTGEIYNDLQESWSAHNKIVIPEIIKKMKAGEAVFVKAKEGWGSSQPINSYNTFEEKVNYSEDAFYIQVLLVLPESLVCCEYKYTSNGFLDQKNPIKKRWEIYNSKGIGQINEILETI